MLEKIKYVNSRGEVLRFGENGIYVNENDLRDWEWSYDTGYGRVRNLSRKQKTRSLPVMIWAPTEAQGLALKNRLHDIVEVDAVAGSPGRIYIGDWYLYCYVVASAKSNYLLNKGILEAKLTVIPDKSVWYCSQLETFGGQTGLISAVVGQALVGFAQVGASSNIGGESFIRYDYDYPRGYKLDGNNAYLVNDSVSDCDWKIIIHGPADNPVIDIGGASHYLEYEIPDKHYVEIDSRQRTITLKGDGVEDVNLFRYRDKENDIFARISSGASRLEWNGEYTFSVELYKERSEPLWT